MLEAEWPHLFVIDDDVNVPTGKGPREVAAEMVCSRVYQLLQILNQKWRVELRGAHVGSVLLRREAIQGMNWKCLINGASWW